LASIIGSVQIENSLDANSLSKDPNNIQAYVNDPLVHPYITVSFAALMLDLGEDVLKSAPTLKIPSLLLAHGDNDKITSYSASKEFMSKVELKDKTFQPYSNGYHESNILLMYLISAF
jgi:acylglycerol lipase